MDKESENLGQDIDPETGNFKEEEVAKPPFEKLIRAQQVGDIFYAPGTLVQSRATGEFGVVESLRKTHDPAYAMQRKTLTELLVQIGDQTQAMPGKDVVATYYYNKPDQRKRLNLPPLEVPLKYSHRFEILSGERVFTLGDSVTVGGVLGRIAVIYPDRNKVGVIVTLKEWAKREKQTGYRKMYEVSPENLMPIEHNPDGTIKGNPRPFVIERVEGRFKVEE